MIPTGENWRIKKALKYMAPEKVLQWARTTICPNINERDIARLQRDLPKPRNRSDASECNGNYILDSRNGIG